MPALSVGSIDLAYEERGSGPAVVLVHGLAADARAWEPVADALAEHARVVAYDRRGYGDSGAPETYVSTTVVEQAEDAAALIEALDAAPVLLCGEDLGALVCLDLLVRRTELVRGAVIVDVPLFAFVPAATEALAAERVALEEAMRDGGPEAAVRAWLGGRVDDHRRDRAAAHPGAFFADYGGLASWPVTRRELRAIQAPVAVVETPGAPAHVREAGDRLAELVPGARRSPQDDAVTAMRALLADA
jgi:pimeloyl-ACP methyl ester carboxylesterase